MHHRSRAATRVAAAIAFALASGAAAAQESTAVGLGTSNLEQGLDWTLRAGVGYSDNLGRDASGAIDSAFYAVGGTLTFARQQGRVDSNVSMDLDWVDYDATGFDSQVWGNLNGNLRYALVPERLVWLFQNDFGQGTRDPFQSLSPDNAENMNYFSTGPELTLRFGDALGALVDAGYSNVWFQDSPNSSDRYEGGLSLFRDFSAASRAYVRGTYQDVQFDSGATAPDFDQTDVLAGYTNSGSRTRLLVEAGYNTLSTENDTQSGPLLRVELSRDLTPTIDGSLRAGQEFKTPRAICAARPISATTPTARKRAARPMKTATSAARSSSRRAGPPRIARRLPRAGLPQTGTGLDRDRLQISAGITRRFSQAWSGRLNVTFESVDYTDSTSVDYDESSYGADVTWRATSAISLTLAYDHFQRPSSSFGNFDENRVVLRGEWSPRRR